MSKTVVVEGTQIEVASLETVNFARLATREPAEVGKLLKAAQTLGIFYLDLKTDAILADLPDVWRLTENYFDQPEELKMKDHRETEEKGYKPGHDESFEIVREDIVNKVPALSGILQDKALLLETFIARSHHVTMTMLSCLSDVLNIKDDARFETSHRDGEPSSAALKLYREPTRANIADVPDCTHTDRGTLTILFSDQWGLQTQIPDTNAWKFVEPRPGHAIVNVADSLQHLSGRRLHSCVHRVTQPLPGVRRRHFVVYLLRPENSLKF